METQEGQVIEPAHAEVVAESAPAPEETAPQGESVEQAEKTHVPPGLQKRIDQLTREKYEAKREAEYLRQLALQNAPQQQQAQPASTQKPTREQFDYDEDRYLEALADYKVAERLEAQSRRQAETRQQQEQQQRDQEYHARLAATNMAGGAKYADWDEVIFSNPTLAVTREMADAISTTDIGHDIAYFLGKNPAEAERIAKMPTSIQYMEIARIESRMKAAPQKKVTAAPAPIEAVGARGIVEVDPDKMTVAEWKAWREEQRRK